MPEQNDFLIEIGTEELPPNSLKKLSSSLTHHLIEALAQAKLSHHEVESFASPRRLGVLVNQLSSAQPDHVIEKTGPFKSAAFNDKGEPTPAALGFAKSCGVDLSEIGYQDTDKGPKLFYLHQAKGQSAVELLEDIVNKALKKLPINKPMRWGQHETKFVRPVHWVLMLFGNEVVPATILGITSGNQTYGHRFHHPNAITIDSPKYYAESLEKTGYVIPCFEKRKDAIIQQLNAESQQINIDEQLLNEVTAIVEWPKALKGSFDERFLLIPEEALITTMKVNQKCFSLSDNQHNLLPNYVTISNIASKNEQRVIEGNNRVIRARLSDAEFFYQVDLKNGLEHNIERLRDVVFQAKLGTMFQKVERVTAIAESIAQQINADSTKTQRSAQLCKADLLTEMVGEFPELQGIMGYYYAKESGEDNAVALAIKEHYLPRHSGDELPQTLEGAAVAIADKLDTLVGIFGINQAPTGVKDPYGLRRAAIGILRIMIEKSLSLDVKQLIEVTINSYAVKLENTDVAEQCFTFILDRLKSYYSDHGISSDIFAAVIAKQPSRLMDFDLRIHAVKHFKSLPEAKALAAANKRVSNILKKQDINFSDKKVNNALLDDPAEKVLASLLNEKNDVVNQYFTDEDYTKALTELASLQQPVDQFFDNVMVMTDNEDQRNNRLALLSHLRHLFLQIADISLLQQS